MQRQHIRQTHYVIQTEYRTGHLVYNIQHSSILNTQYTQYAYQARLGPYLPTTCYDLDFTYPPQNTRSYAPNPTIDSFDISYYLLLRRCHGRKGQFMFHL
ncbi:hypothetical protein BCIN_12g00110 [Botrytis cinerea B05.10]|uniref:Uncharacterized protein n=1 Tax=Botryotinia fuckeliana (strain B05.10) TaxID=332648 RepID=A0A384JY18_BOTFB|nr:hypothetical protein BCIN_12g00110 [Botrytis cinerea B05.10]ATZ55412.1 hypothetical protein BCIN_12g00110 [Botrytis cinerea B05.10]